MSLPRRQTLHAILCVARSQGAALRASNALGTNALLQSIGQQCIGGASNPSSTGWSCCQPTRWLNSSTAGVQGLLDSMQAVKLRDSLEVTSDTKPFMSYKELLNFIIQNGAADTEEEAHKRADALVQAGVVLRFNGVVYLKPQEVSELVYRTLPTDPEHAQRNLAEIEQELSDMDKTHRQISKTAKRWPRFWLWTGFTALTFQLTAFIYLTYWELSWDVMEPIGYMLGLTYSCLAYLYFLMTRGNSLDYGPFEEYWTQQQVEKKMAEKGFDLERYQHLMRTRERYRRYLAAQLEAQQEHGQAADRAYTGLNAKEE